MWRWTQEGRSRFQLLQNAEREPTRLLYCVFDLLYLDGKDLRGKTLLERKAELERILPKSPLLLYSAHVVGDGIKAFNKAKRAQEEGVMAKLAGGRYHSGVRTREWLKVKASQEQEVVIVGFTAPRRSRKYFGALAACRARRQRLGICRQGGTGFDAEALRSLHAMMLPLVTETKPVSAESAERGHHHLGEAEARRRGEVHRMDRSRRDAPPGVPRHAGPTRRRPK